MLVMGGALIFFVAGVRLWKFAALGIVSLGALPVVWSFLRPYQRQRILTFFDPETDPLGAGYHILQAKIALGSGGIFGKGYMQGSQAHLNFLPERQTDFIFTMLAEEFGLVGGLEVLVLFLVLFGYGIAIALRIRNQFGRIVAFGVTMTVSLYVSINIAMVMGLVPVVGAPLPLISLWRHGDAQRDDRLRPAALGQPRQGYRDREIVPLRRFLTPRADSPHRPNGLL